MNHHNNPSNSLLSSNNPHVALATSIVIFISSIAVTIGWKRFTHGTTTPSVLEERSNCTNNPTVCTSSDNNSGSSDDIRPSSSSTSNSMAPSSQGMMNRRIRSPGTITIVYASTTGTCESLAQAILQALTSTTNEDCPTTTTAITTYYNCVQLCPISHVDWWDELLNEDEEEDTMSSTLSTRLPLVLFVLPTWSNGSFPPSATSLEQALQELSTDWRVAPKFLSNRLSFAIFGMGSTAYDSNTFNRPSKAVVHILKDILGARLLIPLGQGDDSVGDFHSHFDTWLHSLQHKIKTDCTATSTTTATVAVKKTKYTNKKMNKTKQLSNSGDNNPSIPIHDDDITSLRGKQENQRHDARSLLKKTNPETSKDSLPSSTSCCAHHEDSQSKTNNSVSGGCCHSDPTNEMPLEETKEVAFDDRSESSSAYESWDDDDDGIYDNGNLRQAKRNNEPDVMDMEDLGTIMLTMQSTGDQQQEQQRIPKEMVTPKQAAALKKEGYKLIGTHSAVKLCRWTKHQLRGRGGCYKHSFYGITSYQCMEATPSLACANKCVFCWRHHKNPVGREWRWKTDDPHTIVAEAVAMHVSMIKEARGIPGVVPERYQEALTVRHCALSLVGEPIMYPRINELLRDLHSRNISSFLVTNGQHPDAIETLIPVTQLYVSVDAPTERSLIDIDRPLFHDAWDRLRRSLTLLRKKRQRTVARLTVVKGWNSDDIRGYAELIALGHVSLVEVKGVTFCGKSDASNLNMSNTPWHHEVVALTVTLQQELAKMTAAGGPDAPPLYDIACEHHHSCCIVLARIDQFACDADSTAGQRNWKTWIDFDKFLLLSRKSEHDPLFTFGVEDYTAETPAWATFGSIEQGFDPTDQRYRKRGKAPLYTKFDARGVPTHDSRGMPLSTLELERLNRLMDEKIAEMGSPVTVVKEMEGGAKSVLDPSLMFRGLVVSSQYK